MKKILKSLLWLVILAIIAAFLWEKRNQIAPLANNNFKIRGAWYQVEMDRKGVDPYTFEERIITFDGTEWGSYELRKNVELEVMVANQLTEYHLSFPDEDNMVWSVERDGELVPGKRWRR